MIRSKHTHPHTHSERASTMWLASRSAARTAQVTDYCDKPINSINAQNYPGRMAPVGEQSAHELSSESVSPLGSSASAFASASAVGRVAVESIEDPSISLLRPRCSFDLWQLRPVPIEEVKKTNIALDPGVCT